MANPQNSAALPRQANPKAQANSMATIAPIVAWLVPGLGHLIQRRMVRGLLLMAAIYTMFFVGLGMQGKVYAFNTGDLLDILGFVGDIGVGAAYFVARMMDWGIGNIHRAVADYGTKYIVVAGLLNIIATVDAYHIAIGKKQ
jgi:hypothetical protein